MVKLIKQNKSEITLEVTIKLDGSILEMENNIQDACNEVGNLATQNALSLFDTDGSPIKIGSQKWTSKGIYPPIVKCLSNTLWRNIGR